jgi:hypothetical protein
MHGPYNWTSGEPRHPTVCFYVNSNIGVGYKFRSRQNVVLRCYKKEFLKLSSHPSRCVKQSIIRVWIYRSGATCFHWAKLVPQSYSLSHMHATLYLYKYAYFLICVCENSCTNWELLAYALFPWCPPFLWPIPHDSQFSQLFSQTQIWEILKDTTKGICSNVGVF